MSHELYRVASYANASGFNVSCLILAKSGFFSTCPDSNGETQCFHCGVKYQGWRKTDNIADVHIKKSPSCEFARGVITDTLAFAQSIIGGALVSEINSNITCKIIKYIISLAQ